MATAFSRRRGTTAEHASFIGRMAELTVDTTKMTVVVHNSATSGGFPLAREDLTNVSAGAFNSFLSGVTISAPIILNSATINNSTISGGEIRNATLSGITITLLSGVTISASVFNAGTISGSEIKNVTLSGPITQGATAYLLARYA